MVGVLLGSLTSRETLHILYVVRLRRGTAHDRAHEKGPTGSVRLNGRERTVPLTKSQKVLQGRGARSTPLPVSVTVTPPPRGENRYRVRTAERTVHAALTYVQIPQVLYLRRRAAAPSPMMVECYSPSLYRENRDTPSL